MCSTCTVYPYFILSIVKLAEERVFRFSGDSQAATATTGSAGVFTRTATSTCTDIILV